MYSSPIPFFLTSQQAADSLLFPAHYREVCRRKNVAFTNVYDVGFLHNLELYFNVGAQSRHGYLSILAPWRIEPYSDGWHWAKTMGMGLAGRHEGISPDDELTDDEEQAQEDR